MSLEMRVFFLVVATGELTFGIMGNGFIGLVNCIKWVKNRKVSSADFILTGLAMTRIIQLWVTLLDSFVIGLFPHLYASGKLAKVILLLWTLTNHLTTWLATCLSIFYFLKIASFSHFFFIWLKWRVNRVVLVFFLGSFFLLLVDFLLQDSLSELWMNIYRVPERNMTLHVDIDKIFYLKICLISFTSVVPFLLSLSALLLLFLSLVRHTKNLQLNQTERDSSTQAHRRAMKMVASFLLLFIIYAVSTLTVTWMMSKIQNSQVMMLVLLIVIIFPSGHSFILIFGNSKLKQTASRLLQHLKFSERNKAFSFIDII